MISFVEKFRSFTRIKDEKVDKPFLEMKGEKITEFNPNKLRQIIREKFAGVYRIDEEPWLRIHE